MHNGTMDATLSKSNGDPSFKIRKRTMCSTVLGHNYACYGFAREMYKLGTVNEMCVIIALDIVNYYLNNATISIYSSL